MDICVLPKIHVISHSVQLFQHPFGIGEFFAVPVICAGICVRVPSRFKSEDVARDLLIAQFLCKPQYMLGIARHMGAVEHAKSPYRRKDSAAGKQVVPCDCVFY